MLHSHGGRGPLDASVGTTFSASMSESVDIDVVDEIISHARDATSFAQVHEAYSTVLELNGIHPSSDKAYYQFLLKLGMIRASTWGERWDVWRAQHDSAPPRPPRKAEAALRRPNPMRARVPFLASASSDLDEGYADESDAHSDVQQRQSPRKAMATRANRKLVGYTPVQSDADDDTFDVPQPIRTSTPVAVQTPHRDPKPTSPPTYSESEMETSQSVTVHFTPKPQRATAELDSAVEAQMEAQADTFHRLGLLGRCFEVWLQSEEWIRRTTEQIDSVRTTLLLRQTLSRWRELHDAQLQLAGTAEAHYAHQLQRQAIDKWMEKLRDRRLEAKERQFRHAVQHVATLGAWQRWRRKLVNRRTAVWAADLKRREYLVKQQVDMTRLRWAFTAWRDATQVKQADIHYVTVLAETYFREWRIRAQQSRSLADKLLVWESQHFTKDLARAFGWWKAKTALQVGEREMSARHETRLVARVWSQWRMVKNHHQVANAFNSHRLERSAFARMVKMLRVAQELRQRKALQFAAQRDLTIVGSAFNTWSRNERARLLARVLETRKTRRVFSAWKRRVETRRDMENEADRFAATSNAKLRHRTFSRWRDILGQKRNSALKADLVFEARTKIKVMAKLQTATARAADNLLTAEKAYAFFALRQGVKTWRKLLVRRRVMSFIATREKRVVSNYMQVWREATAQSILDREQVAQFQALQGRRLLSSALSLWTERVVEIKARELDVAEQRDKTIVHEALLRWFTAYGRKKELDTLLQSHLDIKQEESTRRAFLLWVQKARRSRDLGQKADFLVKEHEDRQKATAFEKWYDLKRERDLGPIAEEVALRHEDALLFSVFDAMLERTPLVLGIQFDKQRLRKSIFPRWQRALHRTRKHKRAAAEHDLRLLSDAFSTWKSAYLTKAAKKPVPRRRRVSSRTRLSAIPPRTSDDAQRAELPRRPQSHRRSLPSPGVYRSATASPDPEHLGRGRRGGSVASEPAYDRLRHELRDASRGRRVVSDEQRGERPPGMAEPRPTSELVRALQMGHGRG